MVSAIGRGDLSGLRWLLLTALGASYLAFADGSLRRATPVFCPFRQITGMRCPLCGMTTATGNMLQGDMRAAMRAHPLAPAVMFGILYWYAATTVRLFLPRAAQRSKENMRHGDQYL